MGVDRLAGLLCPDARVTEIKIRFRFLFFFFLLFAKPLLETNAKPSGT